MSFVDVNSRFDSDFDYNKESMYYKTQIENSFKENINNTDEPET